jgi:protein SCO1/2
MTRARVTCIVTGAALAALLAGCAPGRVGEDDRAAATSDSADVTGTTAAAEASLFELRAAFTDASGRERHLEEWAGQPFVVSMIYTSCQSVCPRITADLTTLDRALPPDRRARTRFVLVSLDPARDTPAALAAFARTHKLDERWTLLAAGEDDMRTLAAILGVRFRPDGEGEIAHSATVAVADARGVIRFRRQGLDTGPAPLVQALAAADEPPAH